MNIRGSPQAVVSFMMGNCFGFVLVIFTIAFINVDSWCPENSDIIQPNVYMDHERYRSIKDSSAYGCAAYCMMSSACMSFNFGLVSRTCELNSKNSSTAGVVSRQGFVFSDIDRWPQSVAGPCSNVNCPEKSSCTVDRMGATSCPSEFQGCGFPPVPAESMVEYDGHYLYAMASYSCDENFKNCLGINTSVCGEDGQWGDVAGLCGRYRWVNPAVSFVQSIPCGPVDELMFFFDGTPSKDAFDFMIDTKKGSDILLHVRCDTTRTILSHAINGNWATGQTLGPLFAFNQRFQMNITLKGGQFAVFVDGTEVASVSEPVSGVQPEYMAMYGDVTAHEITMNPPK